MRNSGIELFRVVCMLAICLRHAVHFSGTAYGFEGRFWAFGVVGFAFISGYYGVTLRFSRVVSLWLIAFYCVGVSTAVAVWNGWGESGLKVFRDFLFTNWYLNGYTILLLLSPILNNGIKALLSMDRARLKVPLFGGVLLVVWSWAQEAWGIRDFVPCVPGNGSHSFMALVYIYVFARIVREWDLIRAISKKGLIYLGCGCCLVSPVVGGYTSLATWGLTFVLFSVFERIELPRWVGRIVPVMVPSLFSVYLIHTNWFVFGMIRDTARSFEPEIERHLVYVGIAFMLFCVSLVLDIPRRFFCAMARRVG